MIWRAAASPLRLPAPAEARQALRDLLGELAEQNDAADAAVLDLAYAQLDAARGARHRGQANRAVLGTGVLVAAPIRPRGVCSQALQTVLDERSPRSFLEPVRNAEPEL